MLLSLMHGLPSVSAALMNKHCWPSVAHQRTLHTTKVFVSQLVVQGACLRSLSDATNIPFWLCVLALFCLQYKYNELASLLLKLAPPGGKLTEISLSSAVEALFSACGYGRMGWMAGRNGLLNLLFFFSSSVGQTAQSSAACTLPDTVM